MGARDITIVDLLSGRSPIQLGMKGMLPQRLYYNCRCGGEASIRAEMIESARFSRHRDFRSQRERRHESTSGSP